MTDQSIAPAATGDVTPAQADAAFAAAKAEALGKPVTPPAATGGDDVGGRPAAEAAAAPAQAAAEAQVEGTPIQIGTPDGTAEGGLEAKDGAGDTIVYDPTGDAGMDLALGFVGKLGIKPTDPEMVEAGKGNFAFLKAKLAGLGDKATGWEQYVALGEKSYADAVKASEAQTASINTAIGTVMNKETLTAVLDFAAKNASDEEKAYFNGQLSGSPLSATIAAKELLRLYQASSGATINPTAITDAPTGNNPGAPAKVLTRKEYTAEVDAIAKRVGGSNLEHSPEYQALNRRYEAQR